MITREDLDYTVEDDGGMLFAVQRTQAGSVSAQVRVYGSVVIDDVRYEYDQNIRVKLAKCNE
jgi:hypothetical protein